MKKHFLQALLFVAGLFACVSASAFDFTVGNIYYNITSQEDKTVEVTLKEEFKKTYSGAVVIPSSVTYSGTTYSVTSIGEMAFYECTGLTGVTIPDSVTLIDGLAFAFCSSLTNIILPNESVLIAEETFRDCTNLQSITIPCGVHEIEDRAFTGTGLKKIYLATKYPPMASEYSFGEMDLSECTLYVPIGSKSAYADDEFWKRFTNVEEFDPVSIKRYNNTKGSIFGEWEHINEYGMSRYLLRLNLDGDIRFDNMSFFEVQSSYSGKYHTDSDGFTFSVKSNYKENEPEIKGVFTPVLDDNGLLTITLKNDVSLIGKAGSKFVFHKEGADFPVSLPAQPTVRDLLIAAHPYIFGPLIREAYDALIHGRFEWPTEEKICEKDLPNGYMKYSTGGAPASVFECCYWKCNTGDYLFAINLLGESPEIAPTTDILFFSFNTAKSTMKSIIPPYSLEKPISGYWSMKLPQKGKDIKVMYLDDNYSEKSSTILKWNGIGFNSEKK